MAASVVSMFPQVIKENKPGVIPGSFIIPAGSPESPTITLIEPAKFSVYMDHDRGSFPVPVSAERLAQSIVEDFCTTQLAYDDEASPAVIWFPITVTLNDLKTTYKATVAEALRKQTSWYKRLVAMADDDWSRHRRHGTISSLQRTAAQNLKLEREWLFLSDDTVGNVTEVKLCPACKAIVVPGASVCQVCRCVMNKEEADKYVFAK